jgi:predicted transcriptional regulator
MKRYNNLIQSEMKDNVNFQLWQSDQYRYEIRVIEQVAGNGLQCNADRVSFLDDLDDMNRKEAIQFFNQQVYSA